MNERTAPWRSLKRREVLELFERRSGELDERTLAQVFDLLRAELPSDMATAEAAMDRRRVLWPMLALNKGGARFPSDLQSAFDVLKRVEPNEESKFANRHEQEPTTGPRTLPKPAPSLEFAERLGRMDVDELGRTLTEPQEYFTAEDEALGKYVDELLRGDQSRLFDAIRAGALTYSRRTSDANLTNAQPTSRFPQYTAELLEKASTSAAPTDRVGFLAAWDALRPFALERTDGWTGVDGEVVTFAINHTAGKLARALLQVAFPDSDSTRRGIPDWTRTRLEDLTTSSVGGGIAARVVVCSRLYVISLMDEDWCREHVIPWLDWGTPEVARACWQGYLWHGDIHAPLFRLIRVPLVESFRHWTQLGPFAETLAGILVSLAIDGDELLEAREGQKALIDAPVVARRQVAWLLARRLEDAEDGAPALWRELIGPWIESSWPRGARYREPETTEALIGVVMQAHDETSNAIQMMLHNNLLGAIGENSFLLVTMSHDPWNVTVLQHRVAVIKLLDRVLPKADDLSRQPRLKSALHRFANLLAALEDKHTREMPELERLRLRLNG